MNVGCSPTAFRQQHGKPASSAHVQAVWKNHWLPLLATQRCGAGRRGARLGGGAPWRGHSPGHPVRVQAASPPEEVPGSTGPPASKPESLGSLSSDSAGVRPSPSRVPPDTHAGLTHKPRWNPGEQLRQALQRFLHALDNAWLRALALLGFVFAIISGVVNFAIVPIVNTTMLPGWQDTASRLLQRKVHLGRCTGVSLLGVTGVVPLLRVGATSLGPGPVERSSLIAPKGIELYLDPITSLVQQQLVLAVALDSPEVTIVQGEGFSFVGYPDDTVPSSRDFLPGLDSGPAASAPETEQGEGPESQPPVALGRVSLRDANLAVLVQSERVPRYWQNVKGSLMLGSQYRSLDLTIQGDVHKRHVSSLKCTVVTPTAKRHLRHVTPGAGTPPPLLFGCDVLPPRFRSGLKLQHIASSAGYEEPEQQPAGNPAPESDANQPSSERSASVHDMVRTKRGRQAEAAAAAGQPLQYTLRSFGTLLSATDNEVAVRAQDAHLAALETGEPHAWPDAPWTQPVTPSGQEETALTPVHPKPQGGRVEVRLVAQHVNTPDMWPDMTVDIHATRLHAPLAERMLELPMDIHAGTLTGNIKIRTYDQKSWQFPELYGRVQCQDASLHFWDASDDILDCSMELVFESDRVYLHSARGWFGAVPLSVAGDLDLNPETGSYRLSASVLPRVEINALRATLGVRPTPQPVAGAIRGVMHCTGPLEHPVFSGSAVAVRIPTDQLMLSEATPAREGLLAAPAAVAVFDRVPLMAATGVFTMDTTTSRFSLHSAQVVPAGGGQLSGQGVMWVAPEAESDPRAINISYEAEAIDVGTVLSSYLSPEMREQLPTGALSSLGHARIRGNMVGSHLAPEVSVQASLPPDSRLLVGASAAFAPSSMSFSAQGPALSLDTTVLISTPHQAELRAADTQTEASFWARPRFEGIDLSASVSELDLLSMARTAAAPALDPVSTGQPLRARCSGNVRCSLRPTAGPPRPTDTQQQPQQQGSKGGSRPRVPAPAGLHASHPSLMFTGQVQLSSMRINNLELVKQVSGQLGVSGLGKVLCSARSSHQAAPYAATPGIIPTRVQAEPEVLDVEVAVPDLLPSLNLDPMRVARAAASASANELDEVNDSRCSLKRGPLLLEASSANGGREYRLGLGGLQLDDLEAGSLRGSLTSAALEANIEARQGRAALCLDSLRYASLAAERLSSSVRWEGDVVKLEETVVIQQGSRYEMDGEVFLPDLLAGAAPAGGPVPQGPPDEQTSASHTAEDKRPTGTARQAASPAVSAPSAEPGSEGDRTEDGAGSAGRWRLAVHVPAANLQDLLPATQLFSATQHPGRDYGSAKSSFLTALESAGQRAVATSSSGLPLSAMATASSHGVLTDAGTSSTSQPAPAASATGSNVLPALQELSGFWSGRIQVWGDVQGASNVEFNLLGRDWRWGAWRVDRVAAVGTADSEEGVGLEELSCVSGPARASLKGALLGSKQDATLAVTNFPLAMLQPLYAALPPALQGVQPPAMSGVSGAMRPFASLSRRLETSMAKLSARLLGEPGQLLAAGLAPEPSAEPGFLDPTGPGAGPQGPMSGLVFMNGWLGGSTSAPEAHLDVKVEQGAVGATRLKQAVAHLAVDAQQRIVASVQLRPADMEGSVSLQASLAGKEPQPASQEEPDPAVSSPAPAPATPAPRPVSRTLDRAVDATVAVRDGGMAVLCALTPALQWQSGAASLNVDVHGSLAAPHARGSVHMQHVSLASPVLKHPVTNLKADIQFTGGHMVVNSVDAKVGRSGRITASGTLPLLPVSLESAAASPARGGDGEVSVNMEGLELRVANTYSGGLDAALLVEGALLAPCVGGSITFSRGTLNLQPPSTSTAPASGPVGKLVGEAVDAVSSASAALAAQDAALVRSAFSLLRAGRKRAAFNAATGAVETQHAIMGGGPLNAPPSRPACQLAGLQLVFGPELRATFPVVLNVAVSGQVALFGPADPLLVSPSGALVLDSGTLNLVATQFTLDREHLNRLLFLPEAGLLDPVLDIVMVSGDLRAVVAGRGSAWQDALTLSAAGTSLSSTGPAQAGSVGGPGGRDAGGPSSLSGRKPGERPAGNGSSAQLELSEVARVFEERLAEALLGENGQLALRSLASSTLHTLLPKLETRGQLGAARWRLVGAPALPNLLGVLDAAAASTPSLASSTDSLDPAKLLSRLAVGTELELMWGNSLTAALQHKLLSDTKIGTEARLTYRITDHLRLNLQLQGLTRPSLTLGYTSANL